VENLVPPDAVRRLSWDPPQAGDQPAVETALTGYGARTWQAELVAGPIADALRNVTTAPDGGASADAPGAT
jgi:ribonuclease D